MANFLDNMKNKGTNLMEQTKLSGELNGLRSQMQQNIFSLGQMLYDSKRLENGPTEQDLDGLMKTIDRMKSDEKEMEKRIALLRGDVLCSKCGAAVKTGNRFCPVCGNEMPAPSPGPVPPAAEAGVCTGCGAPLALGMKFCTKCGTPVNVSVPAAPHTADNHVCAACGAPLANGVRFCSKCGAPTPAFGGPVPPAPVPVPGAPVPPPPAPPAPAPGAPVNDLGASPAVPYGNPEQIRESSPFDKEQS